MMRVVKIISFIIIIPLLFDFVSSVKLGISPAQVDFEGYAGESLCKKINLISETNELVAGIDRWSNEKTFIKEINRYTLNSSNLDIEFNYPKEILIENKSEINLCVKGKEAGTFYGAIIYKTNKSVAVGSWIVLNLTKNENYSEDKLAANDKKAPSQKPAESKKNIILFSFLSSNSILMLILLYLLIKLWTILKKKRTI